MKTIIANSVLRVLLLLAVLSSFTTITAYDFEVDGIYYNINGSEATVTSKGSNYTSNSYSGDVVIPETVTYNDVRYTVTAIGDEAFWWCKDLTSVHFPNTLKKIGSAAFWGCTRLTSIKIPKSVVFISSSIGMSSSSLSNPFAVESITSIQVENGNSKYDSRENCNAIIETETNTLISGCQNTTIPNSVRVIGDEAFSYCHMLTTIEIPNSVTTIGMDAFRECYSLSHLVIPNSVIKIWDRAFYDCNNLISVELPTSLTSFDGLPFYLCNKIKTFIISGEGEWKAGRIPYSLSSTNAKLYIDSRVTSIKNMDALPAAIYCYAQNPPEANGAFYSYTGTLHVPAASLAAYFTAPYWSNFSNIVGDAVEPSDVIINEDSIEMNLGQQFNLIAEVLPENAFPKDIIWTSTNPAIATVNNGTISTINPGECDIIARCLYKKAICHIIVNDTTVTIALDQTEARLLPNHMLTLIPSATPLLPEIVVTSSNPSVAAARIANGKIQVVGIKEGTTIITVGSAEGTAQPATCLVKVYTLRGDVNGDGFINIADVTTLINYVLGGNANGVIWENADANNDGGINIGDVTRLIGAILSGEELDPKEEPIEGAETFTVNGVTFTMMPVEGGTFTMGATPEQGTSDPWNDERPTHEVTLSAFMIGQTEVTQALWQAVMGSNPSEFSDNPNRPVEMVSWDDCQAFIAQLNQLTGRNFRLPTEAEWEYAARGGKQSHGYKYAGGDDVNEVAWWDTNAGDGVGPNSPDYGTHPVRSKKANELGLYDMSGNVWEWCLDWYGSYSSEAQTNPTGPATGSNRVYRGGSWLNYARNCRVSSRYHWTMNGTNYMGLRLAL